MNKMYMELDQIFQLNFGSILLGTTSPDLLLTMVEMERPYFHRHNRDSLLRCLSNGTDCQTFEGQVNDRGGITLITN